jgi:hypothetical protein
VTPRHAAYGGGILVGVKRGALILVAAVALGASADAWAHGSDPAVAYINEPTGVGNVVDAEFFFTWVDADRSIPTGTATVDFYYTNQQPPTFLNGERHPELTGEPIVQGIWEKEMPNEHTWDLTNVPSGSYLLWSEVIEPPEENMAIKIIEFSPGILTVAHAGDPVYPAVYMITPTSPFQFSDDYIDVRYAAFDPDGTARVKIEASMDPNFADPILVADDLAANAEGSFGWDTSELAEADWILKATITDARGLSHYHYGRYFLLVTHAVVRPDAGLTDAGDGERDGGTGPPPPRDAGYVKIHEDPKTCDCTAGSGRRGGRSSAMWLYGIVIILWCRSIQYARR